MTTDNSTNTTTKCRIKQMKLCNNDDCELCFNRSFASHEKSKYFSERNKLDPRQVPKNSNFKYWFDCDKCDHKFYSILNNVVGKNRWCPYCANQQLCTDDNCNDCYQKSFASLEKSKYLSDRNIKNARQIFKGSITKYWFDCDKCFHSFCNAPAYINYKNSWCPFCVNQKLCTDNDCDFCFNKSFASHEKSKNWSKKNKLSPRQVFKNSNKNFKFNCGECKYKFVCTPSDVNGKNAWCPVCVNKSEKKLYNWLKLHYPKYKIKTQKTFDWCRYSETNRYARYDFCISGIKILIELDGKQHFEHVPHWKNDVDKNISNDVFKIKQALKNGYSIIHIYQPDVHRDINDWEDDLCDTINDIINKKYSKPSCIFINTYNMFEDHIKQMKKLKFKLIE
jgi:very-short-patch-repair endonuclease